MRNTPTSLPKGQVFAGLGDKSPTRVGDLAILQEEPMSGFMHTPWPLTGADLQSLELWCADKIARADLTPRARLIVAAPALKKALEGTVEECEVAELSCESGIAVSAPAIGATVSDLRLNLKALKISMGRVLTKARAALALTEEE